LITPRFKGEVPVKITVGKFDPDTRMVPCTFAHGPVTHRRMVNAVLNDQGEYDAKATRIRAEEVGAGVAHKIELGLITAQPDGG
jgi:hypothetical protein